MNLKKKNLTGGGVMRIVLLAEALMFSLPLAFWFRLLKLTLILPFTSPSESDSVSSKHKRELELGYAIVYQ